MFVKPLEWSDDYNVGVPIVDDAHKGVVSSCEANYLYSSRK